MGFDFGVFDPELVINSLMSSYNPFWPNCIEICGLLIRLIAFIDELSIRNINGTRGEKGLPAVDLKMKFLFGLFWKWRIRYRKVIALVKEWRKVFSMKKRLRWWLY